MESFLNFQDGRDDADVVFTDCHFDDDQHHSGNVAAPTLQQSPTSSPELMFLRSDIEKWKAKVAQLERSLKQSQSEVHEMMLTYQEELSTKQTQFQHLAAKVDHVEFERDKEHEAVASVRDFAQGQEFCFESQMKSLIDENESLKRRNDVLEIRLSLLMQGIDPGKRNQNPEISETSATVDARNSPFGPRLRKRKIATFGRVQSDLHAEAKGGDASMVDDDDFSIGVHKSVFAERSMGFDEILACPFVERKKRRLMTD